MPVNAILLEKEIVNIDHCLQIEMLEYRQNRLRMDPLNCNEVSPSSENVDSLEFCRVRCRGVFDEKKSIFIGPRSRSISGVTENGYYVITPLMPLANDPKRYMYIKLSRYSSVHWSLWLCTSCSSLIILVKVKQDSREMRLHLGPPKKKLLHLITCCTC